MAKSKLALLLLATFLVVVFAAFLVIQQTPSGPNKLLTSGGVNSNASAQRAGVGTRDSLEAAKDRSVAAAMGTGSGSIVFLAGLFPLSYILKKDVAARRKRTWLDLSTVTRGDVSRERLGRG